MKSWHFFDSHQIHQGCEGHSQEVCARVEPQEMQGCQRHAREDPTGRLTGTRGAERRGSCKYIVPGKISGKLRVKCLRGIRLSRRGSDWPCYGNAGGAERRRSYKHVVDLK